MFASRSECDYVRRMRDLETISTAITIAETGHLVLATLHTFSAIQTIDRIIDIFSSASTDANKIAIIFCFISGYFTALLPKIGGGRIVLRNIV